MAALIVSRPLGLRPPLLERGSWSPAMTWAGSHGDASGPPGGVAQTVSISSLIMPVMGGCRATTGPASGGQSLGGDGRASAATSGMSTA
jgi:hypothetical protein